MRRECIAASFTVIVVLAVYSNIVQYNWTKPRVIERLRSAETTTRNTQFIAGFHCTETFKRNHFIYLDFKPGRTGNAFFQVCCLLAISKRNCYTPILHRQNGIFQRHFVFLYDLKNIQMPDQEIDNRTFRVLPAAFVNERRKFGLQDHYNWTLRNRCKGNSHIEDQEEFVRSSMKLKTDFVREAERYIKNSFSNRSTVAIHARRTDRINSVSYEYQDLKWYVQYISQAMEYLNARYTNLSFIFVSDDIGWCRENFFGPNIHFSKGDSVGFDLALLGLCDHVILTTGTFGRNGAWLGEHKTVIYSKYFGFPGSYKNDFFMKSWTGV